MLQTHGQTGRPSDTRIRQTDRRIDGQREGETYWTVRLTKRDGRTDESNIQTNRQTGGHTDIQADGQTDKHSVAKASTFTALAAGLLLQGGSGLREQH